MGAFFGRMVPGRGDRNDPIERQDPDSLRLMSNAFDRACNFLPVQVRDSDSMRRKLALHIIRQVDDGESDPTRIADSAILSILPRHRL